MRAGRPDAIGSRVRELRLKARKKPAESQEFLKTSPAENAIVITPFEAGNRRLT